MSAMADDPKDIAGSEELETPVIIPPHTPAAPQGAAAPVPGMIVPPTDGAPARQDAGTGPVRPVSPPPTPTHAPAVQVPAAAADPRMQSDIQKILGAVKLPERRGSQPEPAAQRIPVAPIAAQLDAPPQVTPEPEKPIVTAMHTLKDDIQTVVRVDQISLVRAASLEEDRKMREAQQAQSTPARAQRRSRTMAIVFTSALLVFLGLAAIGGVFLVMSAQQSPAQKANTGSIMFAEQNLLLPIDNTSPASLKQQIAQFRNAQVGTLGSITRIVPTIASTTADGTSITRPATTQEFLHALGANIPDGLARSLGGDFFFGMHSADKNAPVFVIPVVSYDNAFAGMLAWENTMNADLAPVFTAVPAYRTDQNGIPQARTFADTVIRNYDARTLSDDNNVIELYYSFPSPQFLVIAESPYTFAEVLARLRAQREL